LASTFNLFACTAECCRYKLPAGCKDANLDAKVSPLIEALPGKGKDPHVLTAKVVTFLRCIASQLETLGLLACTAKCRRYKLPTAFKDAKLNTVVSPYIEALPGKGDDGGLPSPAEKLAGDIWNTIVNNIFATVPGLLVTFIDGNNGKGPGFRLPYDAHISHSFPPPPPLLNPLTKPLPCHCNTQAAVHCSRLTRWAAKNSPGAPSSPTSLCLSHPRAQLQQQ
jgi:hypothetical protein